MAEIRGFGALPHGGFGDGLEWKCKKPPMEFEDPMEAVIGAISWASYRHAFQIERC